MLVAAVNGNERGYGEVFDLILEQDENTEVSEDTLKAVAGNTSSGVGIFSAILSHKKEIAISEDTMKAAAGNTWGPDIFLVILSHNGEIEIGDDALKAAISNKWNGSDIFRANLNHKKNVVISTNSIRAIAEDDHYGQGIMNELMDDENWFRKYPFRREHEFLRGRFWNDNANRYVESDAYDFSDCGGKRSGLMRWGKMREVADISGWQVETVL